MAWSGLTLTIDGRQALTDAQMSNAINFKAIVIGDGAPPTNFNTQKDLVHQLYQITDIDVEASEEGCTITGDFPIVDYDYYFREIGLLVTTDNGDKLYVYDNCGADAQYIVSTTGVETSRKRIRLSLVISNVAEITVSTPSILYVDYETYKKDLSTLVSDDGGDISNTIVKSFGTCEEEFPVPEPGEDSKTLWGKVKKFAGDMKDWMTGVCLLGHIVNNCVTDRADLPLSAAQGKVLMDLYTVLNTKLSEKSIVATYDIPDRDGVSTKPDYISTGFHNVTQYSNGQYIYSIQAFVYPTSLKDSVIGNIPAQYMHIKQDVYSYSYDMTGNRFLLIRITPAGEIRLETLNGTAIPQAEVRMRGSIVF